MSIRENGEEDCVHGGESGECCQSENGNEEGSALKKAGNTKILGFLCNWCAYAGADLAGVSRVQYPPDMRVIRVMCSGRVDPILILRAFREGSDGVAVLGCHPGDCHYQSGNYQAERKIRMTLHVLEKIGVDPKRLYLDWVSAAEGTRFGEVVTDFIDRIHALGPIDRSGDFLTRISLGEEIIASERIRWLVGKEFELNQQGNVYQEKLDQEKLVEVLRNNIDQEYDRERIRVAIEENPRTVKDIAHGLDMQTSRVFRYLTDMENDGLVILTEFQGNTPFYLRKKIISDEGGE